MSLNHSAFSRAIQKVVAAHSPNPTKDCQYIAVIAQDALKRLGIKSRLVAGYAGWRVDSLDAGAVSVHHPSINKIYESNDPNGFWGHVWLEVDQCIVDFTTFQIPFKINRLDSIDGRKTTITWKPDYLWLPKTQLLSLHKLINGFKTGAYYEKDLSVMRDISKKPPEYNYELIDLILRIYQSELNQGMIQINVTGQSSEFYQRTALYT